MGRKSTDKKRIKNPKKKVKYIKKVIPIFAEKGLKGFTMDELAKALEVTKATLYNHFPTKKALVSDVLAYIVDNIYGFEAVLTNPELGYLERYFRSVKILLDNVSQISNIMLDDLQLAYPDLWLTVDMLREYAARVLREFYRQGQENGDFKGYNLEVLVLTDRIFLDSMANARLLDSHDLNLETAFKEYFKLKFFGMSNFKEDEIEALFKSVFEE